ncbi:RIP metalloprotease RseP, partial [filamentous cyanobacterium CCP2]
MSVLAAIAVLALLIVVHELGHFLAARLQGIHVNRFSLGFGPILWKYQGRRTEYAVRAIPLGGFVGFPDDDPDSDIPPHDPNLLRNRPVIDRAIVISAGVIANLIFAYFVFATQFVAVGIPQFSDQAGVLVADVVSQEAPAAQAGLRAEDVIVAVDNESLGSGNEARIVLMERIQDHANQPIELTVQRGERQVELTVTPQAEEDGIARIGVQLLPNRQVTGYRPPNGIMEVFSESARVFQNAFLAVAQGFITLITNFSSVASQVGGPVKIVEQGASFAGSDATRLFDFTALISINLAIINILPLPALDGGQ